MLRSALFLSLIPVLAAPHVCAQGLRVSTVVYDAAQLDSSGNERVLASSFSLFHNGRVYDYVEAAGEVVVFEPTAKRFTIINQDRGVYTTVPFDEVRHLLKARGPKMEEYIRELKAQKSSDATKAARVLSFQLEPKFDTNFNDTSGLLTLRSPSWKYTVSTREWENGDQLKQYIAYTDWTAMLNCILHPSGSFPEPRLALNEQLRQLDGRIPVIVQLDLRPDERRILRAEHTFVRNLNDGDQQLITQWDKAVKGTDLREVPFRSYQQTVLLSQGR